MFSSKVLRALTPSGHNDPLCWDVDNCDKKTRNIFFTSLSHEIVLVNRMRIMPGKLSHMKKWILCIYIRHTYLFWL